MFQHLVTKVLEDKQVNFYKFHTTFEMGMSIISQWVDTSMKSHICYKYWVRDEYQGMTYEVLHISYPLTQTYTYSTGAIPACFIFSRY